LGSQLGQLVAFLFALGLLVSGLASTAVGSHAGAIIMEGFLNKKIPQFLRRVIVITPAILILWIGVDPTRALVISQVALSFGIPFALIPLALITASKRIMGLAVNKRVVTIAMWIITLVVIILNGLLIKLTFFGA